MKTTLLISTCLLMLFIASKSYGQKKQKSRCQIEALEKEKRSRTAAEKKIDSQLLQAIREHQGRKMAPGVDLEPSGVNADAKGNVQVDITADVTDQLISKIKVLGGTVIHPSKEYHTIRAAVNLSKVEKIAALPEVKFVAAAAVPQLNNPVREGKLIKPGTDKN